MSVDRSISFPDHINRRPDAVAITQKLIQARGERSTKNVLPLLEDLAKTYIPGLETLRVPTSDGNPDNESLIVGRGLRSGKVPVFMFVNHGDVAYAGEGWQYPPFGGVIDGGRIFGRGGSDSQGSTAAFYQAMIDGRDQLPRSFSAITTADEEGSLKGMLAVREHMRMIIKQDPEGKPVTIVAGGNFETFGVGTRGIMEADIEIRGETSHGALATKKMDARKGRNAVLDHLENLAEEMPIDPVFGASTFTVGGDESGLLSEGRAVKTTNQRPDIAMARWSLRLNSQRIGGRQATPESIQEIMNDVLNPEGLRSRVMPLAYIDAAMSDRQEVRWVLDIISKVTGTTPEEYKYDQRGLDEAIALLEMKPKGFIIAGPGTLTKDNGERNYHSKDEYVEVENLRNYAEIYRQVLTDSRHS